MTSIRRLSSWRRKWRLFAIIASASFFIIYPRHMEQELSYFPGDLYRSSSSCAEPHTFPDGGDCQALQGRNVRPDWACFSDMRASLPKFVQLYHQRPVRNNAGGMRFDHSFALYYTLQHILPVPETVIESGAFKGHGTWIIRQALPSARIFSLDPRAPPQRLPGVEYMVETEWLDLAQVDWKAKGVDPEKAVLFIDDHQSGYRRSLLELMPQGFSRFIHEDNYPYLKGDNMSYKWTCELQRKSEWPGRVPDNFAREEKDLTWEQHLKQAQYLQKILQTYYEFPPVLSSDLSGQTRYDPARTSAPIVTDQAFFQQSGLAALDRDEYSGYTHFNYIELRRDVSEAPPGFSS